MPASTFRSRKGRRLSMLERAPARSCLKGSRAAAKAEEEAVGHAPQAGADGGGGAGGAAAASKAAAKGDGGRTAGGGDGGEGRAGETAGGTVKHGVTWPERVVSDIRLIHDWHGSGNASFGTNAAEKASERSQRRADMRHGRKSPRGGGLVEPDKMEEEFMETVVALYGTGSVGNGNTRELPGLPQEKDAYLSRKKKKPPPQSSFGPLFAVRRSSGGKPGSRSKARARQGRLQSPTKGDSGGRLKHALVLSPPTSMPKMVLGGSAATPSGVGSPAVGPAVGRRGPASTRGTGRGSGGKLRRQNSQEELTFEGLRLDNLASQKGSGRDSPQKLRTRRPSIEGPHLFGIGNEGPPLLSSSIVGDVATVLPTIKGGFHHLQPIGAAGVTIWGEGGASSSDRQSDGGGSDSDVANSLKELGSSWGPAVSGGGALADSLSPSPSKGRFGRRGSELWAGESGIADDLASLWG